MKSCNPIYYWPTACTTMYNRSQSGRPPTCCHPGPAEDSSSGAGMQGRQSPQHGMVYYTRLIALLTSQLAYALLMPSASEAVSCIGYTQV